MTASDDELTQRDVAILQELTQDPHLSMRELADVLADHHGIDTSHVTVSQTLREMRDTGVFRDAILPNEAYFRFALFEFKLNPPAFADEWREAMTTIRDSPNTLFYFLSDGEYQWKAVMMFPNARAHSQWIHDFYKQHGDLILNLRNTVAHNILKFQTDPPLFGSLVPADE